MLGNIVLENIFVKKNGGRRNIAIDAEAIGSIAARLHRTQSHQRFATAVTLLRSSRMCTLCRSSAEPRRWAPPLVTRSSVVPRA